MAIKRYFEDIDNTITNAFKEDLATRGTGSNMGQSDILEVFSIYGQATTSSTETARTLIQFPTTTIASDRTAGTIPASGSVSFYLKMYNAEHSQTLPKDYYITVAAVSASWQEGHGLDMEQYTDLTHDNTGSNWIQARSSGSTDDGKWGAEGGDYHTDNSSSFTQHFKVGNENLEIDVTPLVEQWVNSAGNVLGSKSNYGFMVKLSDEYEGTSSANVAGAANSYFTKRFFGRGTEFFFKRPTIEARWDSTRRDNRGNFYFSSSLAPANLNLNNLFLYNYIRGTLQDIGGKAATLPVLQFYYSSGSSPEGSLIGFKNSSNVSVMALSASRVSKGIYKAQFAVTAGAVTTTYPYLVDVWKLDSGQIHTGSAISPKKHSMSDFNPNGKYVVSIPNLKKSYSNQQTERFRIFVREKNWSPNVYSKSTGEIENLMIESASYQVNRSIDDKVVIPYGTGSDNHTVLSFDVSGNYFDLDMSMLEAGYSYDIKYSFYEDILSSYREQPYVFKIRVDKDEY